MDTTIDNPHRRRAKGEKEQRTMFCHSGGRNADEPCDKQPGMIWKCPHVRCTYLVGNASKSTLEMHIKEHHNGEFDVNKILPQKKIC